MCNSVCAGPEICGDRGASRSVRPALTRLSAPRCSCPPLDTSRPVSKSDRFGEHKTTLQMRELDVRNKHMTVAGDVVESTYCVRLSSRVLSSRCHNATYKPAAYRSLLQGTRARSSSDYSMGTNGQEILSYRRAQQAALRSTEHTRTISCRTSPLGAGTACCRCTLSTLGLCLCHESIEARRLEAQASGVRGCRHLHVCHSMV